MKKKQTGPTMSSLRDVISKYSISTAFPKRYHVTDNSMTIIPHGKWVKWEDVESIIKQNPLYIEWKDNQGEDESEDV